MILNSNAICYLLYITFKETKFLQHYFSFNKFELKILSTILFKVLFLFLQTSIWMKLLHQCMCLYIYIYNVVIRTTPDSVCGLTSAGLMGRKKRETAGCVPTHQHLVADVLLPRRSACSYIVSLHCSVLFT